MNFSVGALGGYLLHKGKTVKIIDEEIEPLERSIVDNKVASLAKPYIFGITTTTLTSSRVHQIAGWLKDWYPGSYVIVGGIHPTVMPEEMLRNHNIDIVVRKEGEITLEQIYDRLKSVRDFRDIKGISYRQNERIISNADQDLIADLDEVGLFPFELFGEHISRYNLQFLIVSRGCPYHCIFCSGRSVSGLAYRFYSPEMVLRHVAILVNTYKQTYIHFNDDNFVVNKKWMAEVCSLIREHGFHRKVKFGCNGRADNVNEEMLATLRATNFRLINLGIETASNRLLKLIKKGETLQEITDGIRLIKKYGFTTHATFIMGLPTETAADREASISFVINEKIDIARFNNATPFPGTELYRIAALEHKLTILPGWRNFNSITAMIEGGDPLPYVPAGTTEDELRKDIVRANYRAALRLRSLPKLLLGDSPLVFPKPARWYVKPAYLFDLVRLGFDTVIKKAISRIGARQ